ncbi:HET-domain-containing protein [Nemania sp. NC0429]|nr:HET-domain-containing protein [Nemania sp. NC0429]
MWPCRNSRPLMRRCSTSASPTTKPVTYPCSVCRDLVPLPGPSGGFITGGHGIALANSASGCMTCSILWEGLSTLCAQDPEGVQWIALKQDEDAFRLQYLLAPENKLWIGLHFYTRSAESPMSDIFKLSRDLEQDTACPRYLSQAKGWIRDCCETHDRCKESLSTTLPTRVLDVSLDPDFVFLRQSAKTEKGSYVALSHVWGGLVPIRTTAETMPLFEKGIRLEALPQTFRDAVFMTRYLDCRYLWIDSLCIVQDSREDWETEAGRMAQVYGNALVTLAAVRSANSNGGLFSKHDANAVKHTIRRVQEGGIEIIVEVRPALEHTSYYTGSPYGLPPDVNAWLLGRAWCYQEYLLSPRVLLFTEWETLWVCRFQRDCNCGLNAEAIRSLVSESELKIRFDRILRNNSSFAEVHLLWTDIVSSYSLKDITFATNKLPALAGIASLFADKDLGLYLNGLWEKTLIWDLFWEISQVLVDYWHIKGGRSGDASMPSWSWASVDCPIEMVNRGTIIEGLQVLEIASESDMSGPTPNIPARCLTLRGLFIGARVWGDLSSPRGRLLSAEGIEPCRWALDVPEDVRCGPDEPMDAFIFCGSKGPGLVLAEVQPSGNIYRRLGKIRTLPEDRDQFAVRTIKLN